MRVALALSVCRRRRGLASELHRTTQGLPTFWMVATQMESGLLRCSRCANHHCGYRVLRQCKQVLADVTWPGGHVCAQLRQVCGKQRAGGFFKTWLVASHRMHEAVGGFGCCPQAVRLGAGAQGPFDQFAQCYRSAAALRCQPFPAARQAAQVVLECVW